jgi:GDP-4-dehydro-6-deoxy-D-mannose reductase
LKVLITGVTGFVGNYLSRFLQEEGYEVWGTSLNSKLFPPNIKTIDGNLFNQSEAVQILDTLRPDYVYHLAGQSNVRRSWDEKIETFESNVILTLSLMESIRQSGISSNVRVLTVGSSEEYGKVENGREGIHEGVTVNPQNPYAVSKATISMISLMYYRAYGIRVNHVRPFNHIGPGQRTGFVVSDFASQIASIERQSNKGVMQVGNLNSYRDFLDVRDIVKAYHCIQSKTEVVGQIINICSSQAISINDVLNKLLTYSTADIKIEIDASKFRPVDVPYYIGDNRKLKGLTRWEPDIPIDTTLKDILSYFRNDYSN